MYTIVYICIDCQSSISSHMVPELINNLICWNCKGCIGKSIRFVPILVPLWGSCSHFVPTLFPFLSHFGVLVPTLFPLCSHSCPAWGFLFPVCSHSCPTLGFLFPLCSHSCPTSGFLFPLWSHSCPTLGFLFPLCSHFVPILVPLWGSPLHGSAKIHCKTAARILCKPCCALRFVFHSALLTQCNATFSFHSYIVFVRSGDLISAQVKYIVRTEVLYPKDCAVSVWTKV